MNIHDISVPLSSDTVAWPGTPVWAEQTFFVDIARGDPVTGSYWTLNTHAGTHIDAPTHFIPSGNDVAATTWDYCLGRCLVVEIGDVGREIRRADLEAIPQLRDHRRVLFRTANSRRDLWSRAEFDPEYVALAPAGAEYLVELGYLLAGIDYQGIERFDTTTYGTHTTLLGNNCLILEGADLRAIQPGEYFLICLPLRLLHGEGSPVRAILVEPADEGLAIFG